MTINLNQEKHLDAVLGTPSSQTILRLLAIWANLSAKEIILKSELSESQIHATLNRLISTNIIMKVKKGIYQYSMEKFPQSMQQAYIENGIHRVNEIIYKINTLLTDNESNKAHSLYKHLLTIYNPILKKYFSHLMSSLTHSFLEIYENR